MTNIEKQHECERKCYHLECLIRCLEAKLARVEPLSVEYDEVLRLLDQTGDEARTAVVKLINVRLEGLDQERRVH